jgi:UTP--glucose-1-phosphate uridylyltransferase
MTPDLFDCVKCVARGKQGEVRLTEAIRELLNERDVFVHMIEGSRHEAGDKIGSIKAVIDFVLERPDLRGGIERYLEGKISNPDKK